MLSRSRGNKCHMVSSYSLERSSPFAFRFGGGSFSFSEVFSCMSLIDNCVVKTEVLK